MYISRFCFIACYIYISSSGDVVKDVKEMLEITAIHYEEIFIEPGEIMRPHPYVDARLSDSEITDESIPLVEIKEVIQVVNS